MYVFGYRTTTDFVKATAVFKKHTKYDNQEIKNLIKQIKEGNVIQLENDFVLREDLEDLDFLIS
jgi:predicted transcriptional regulator